MEPLHLAILRCYQALVLPPPRDERGDVPGWVMITVMTAGLVAMLAKFVGPELSAMLRDAFASVR